MLFSFLPYIFIFIPLGILFMVMFFIRRRENKQNKRHPFTRHILRSPGESLRYQINAISDEITVLLISVLVFPIVSYAIYLSRVYFGNQRFSTHVTALFVIICAGITGYFIYKLVDLLIERKHWRLGYEGEVAVGQELNALMLDGYHIYHDFPGPEFNIDHIVVGSAGVFAIETKTRSKKHNGNGKYEDKVISDGKKLQFAGGRFEIKPLEQAKAQAVYLSKWLSSAVGEKVWVEPMVTIPGWNVIRNNRDGIPVLNPKNVSPFLKSRKESYCSEPLVKRICHRIDQKCRDIKPGEPPA